MIAYLVDKGRPAECDFAWEHPQYSAFPGHIQEQLFHARCFSLTMLGAALLYNLMLAEKRESQALTEEYRGRLDEWWVALEGERTAVVAWDRDRFWEIASEYNPRIPYPTRQFVNSWLNVALEAGSLGAVVEGQRARKLISERERRLKRSRARLHNARALENWRGKSGTAQLDYRWNAACRIINDILAGKKGG